MKATTSEERIQKYARIKNQQYRQPGKSCDINLSCLTKPHLKFEPIYKDICEIKKYFAKETSSNLITMVKSSNLYGSFGEIKRFIMCINGKCVDGTWNYSQEMINDFREISRSLYLLHIKLTAIIHMVENPNEDLPNLDMTWSDQVLKVVHLAEESVEDLNNSIAELQPFSSEVKYYLEHNQIEKKGWNYRCELFFEAFDLQVE